MTLPTAKAGGFLVQRPQPSATEETKGITQSPQACRFGRVPPYHGKFNYADKPIVLRPSARMFCAALMSRSWNVPHCGQVQNRMLRSLTSLLQHPQQPQVWLDGKNLSITTSSFPYQSALQVSCRRISPHEVSAIWSASLWLRIMFFPDCGFWTKAENTHSGLYGKTVPRRPVTACLFPSGLVY